LSDGDETITTWREAGRWWDNEPYREIARVLKPGGRIVEEIRESACLGDAFLQQEKSPLQEDHTVDLDLRLRKERDEKVRMALGKIPVRTYTPLREEAKPYALLHTVSGYSLGLGAMLADEIAPAAAMHGIPSVLLADRFSLAGVVEFQNAAKQVNVKALIGASITLPEGGEIVLVAKTSRGYRSLSRLITECHLKEPRTYPLSTWERLEHHAEDLLCLTGGEVGPLTRHLPSRRYSEAQRLLERLVGLYGRENVVVQIDRSYVPWEKLLNEQLLTLAKGMGLMSCAGGLVSHARREHFPAQDVIACIHSLCAIEEIAGRKQSRDSSQPFAIDTPARSMNAERFIRSPNEMCGRFADCPDLLSNTLRVAERCEDDVLPKRTELPKLYDDDCSVLRAIVYAGAHKRYRSIHRALQERIDRELSVITGNGYSGHFLIAAEVADWAECRGIQFSGRGSVVDSVIAYCLGLSRIDAFQHNLAFERFMPSDNSKRPDIDIDFDSQRRDEVRAFMISRFRSENVATVGAFGAFSTRGIVREVGKVMGLPEDTIRFLAKKIHGGISPKSLEDALERRPELRDSGIPKERFRWVFRLAERLTDIPRNVRSHPSGVIVSRSPIADTVPVMQSAVEGVNIIQWDKRSAKRCFDKFDILCLRALDILSHTQTSVRMKDPTFSAQEITIEDPDTFRAMSRGELIGITQSASPAMTSAHVRMRTANLKDAALVQACIRPGVGGCIKNDELISRKNGMAFTYEHPDMEQILGRTYGIVVFQEQVDELLSHFAGYSSGEAESIREGIYKRRRENYIQTVKEEIKRRVVGKGYGERIAEIVFDYVAPYQGYGFAEGHALAFAETSIRSLWAKINLPSEFFAAVLEAQPAGYYPSHTLAVEARIRGVKLLPPSVNISGLSYCVEDVMTDDDPLMIVPNGGVRFPLTRIAGLSEKLCERVVIERRNGRYQSLAEFSLRTQPEEDELQYLILSGAFDELHPNRRGTLWGVTEALQYARSYGNREGSLPMYVPPPAPPADVEDFLKSERALIERRLLGLDIEHHLMSYERDRVARKGTVTTRDAREAKVGECVMVVGNPLRLRMPPTRSGKRVVFFDLEDETGLLNVTCFDDVYLKYGHAFITNPYVVVWVTVQDRQGHKAFLLSKSIPYRPTFSGEPTPAVDLPLVTADFIHG
jgi:error-prone DNA polymerase